MDHQGLCAQVGQCGDDLRGPDVSVVPDAKVSSDPINKMLIVTASAKDHTKIQAVLDQADKRGGGGELVTKAYPLRTANPSRS